MPSNESYTWDDEVAEFGPLPQVDETEPLRICAVCREHYCSTLACQCENHPGEKYRAPEPLIDSELNTPVVPILDDDHLEFLAELASRSTRPRIWDR